MMNIVNNGLQAGLHVSRIVKSTKFLLVAALIVCCGNSWGACKILSDEKSFAVGEVNNYGDLKIRFNGYRDDKDKNTFAALDIKTADGASKSLALYEKSPLILNLCGEDVTITADMRYLNIDYVDIRISLF